jgi:hypothetical protein
MEEGIKELCKTCNNKIVDFSTGSICRVTKAKPYYSGECENYDENTILLQKFKNEREYLETIKVRKKIIALFSLVLVLDIVSKLISYYIDSYYDTTWLVIYIGSFSIQGGLLYGTYSGLDKVRETLIYLAICGVMVGVYMTLLIDNSHSVLFQLFYIAKLFLYVYLVNLIMFDLEFKRFFEYQHKNR